MLRSMTGYGRAQRQGPLGQITVEIQSLNRKFLDLSIYLPKELSQFDPDIRKWVSSQAERGQINVRISAYFDQASPMTIRPNLPLARQIKDSYDHIATELALPDSCTLSLLTHENLLIYEGIDKSCEETLRQALQEVINAALQEWNAMRIREGDTLTKEICQRIKNLDQYVAEIEKYSANATRRYREKLLKNIQELLPATQESDERILREIALFADRVDITEEITRLKSHFQQALSLIDSPKSSGKTLEFLLQEMQREINTIGSKSSEIEVSRRVVEGKAEIERLREQLQNIE